MKRVLMMICASLFTLVISNGWAKGRNTIFIYNDEGVSAESLTQAMTTFKKLAKAYPIKTLNANQLKKGLWTKKAILFVMPGGADLPYTKKLNGNGNAIIRQYVQNGGSFLGLCAGAYYASASIVFDENGPLEVIGDRELRFFKGRSIGPILAPYDYKSQSGSRAAKITTRLSPSKTLNVFYNGGGYFENAELYPSTRVIGRYENHLPAIILVKLGKGHVLLSAVHFEYDPAMLNTNDHYLSKIVKPLLKSNDDRKALFIKLMQCLNLPL